MDRTQELLKHITRQHRGVEIGPSHSPLAPKRLGFQTLTLDVFDAATLRSKAEADPNVPKEIIANIEDVDLRGSAGDIADLVRARCGDEVRLDYVLSSHNLEHLPDPIRFLQGCERILKPDGVVSLAIPDRRFCFDYFRPVTTLADWLEAYREARKQPTPEQVFRHNSMHSLRNGQIAWSATTDGHFPTPIESLEVAFDDWQRAISADGTSEYRDAHCWAFTPSSFELIVSDLQYLGLVALRPIETPVPNGFEFYVHLRNVPGSQQERAAFYNRRANIMRRAAQEAASQ
jgi:SAM-dependent methyltransferase